MALLRKNRTAQYPLVADFTFTMADTLADITRVVKSLNAVGSSAYEPIGLPPGAVVIGGELVVSVASNDAGAATVAVGDSASATRYLVATNIKAVGRTALTLTGFVGAGEDVRITVANASGGATLGTVTLRVQYVIAGRSNETQTN